MIERRVLGVDFSGARDAGNRIWVAEGVATAKGVKIDTCRRARDLPGGAVVKDAALEALVTQIALAGDAVIGLDFPFSLPASLIVEPDWESFVASFADKYPTADSFRDACRLATGGKELKRRTDVESRVPFGVFNLRLYRQTHAGISQVLRPLVTCGAVCVVPMQPPEPGKPTLVEACPASLLKREGLYPSYKGNTETHDSARRDIVGGLMRKNLLAPLPRSLRSTVLGDPGGDALDAVIAAICAFRAAIDPTAFVPRDDLEALEARVFF